MNPGKKFPDKKSPEKLSPGKQSPKKMPPKKFWINFIGIIWLDKLLMLFKATKNKKNHRNSENFKQIFMFKREYFFDDMVYVTQNFL